MTARGHPRTRSVVGCLFCGCFYVCPDYKRCIVSVSLQPFREPFRGFPRTEVSNPHLEVRRLGFYVNVVLSQGVPDVGHLALSRSAVRRRKDLNAESDHRFRPVNRGAREFDPGSHNKCFRVPLALGPPAQRFDLCRGTAVSGLYFIQTRVRIAVDMYWSAQYCCRLVLDGRGAVRTGYHRNLHAISVYVNEGWNGRVSLIDPGCLCPRRRFQQEVVVVESLRIEILVNDY